MDRFAVVEVGAGGGGALGEVRVQPAALRHVRQRRAVLAVEGLAEAQGEARAVDRALDYRREVHVLYRGGAQRDAAAAGLVARKAVLVQEQHADAALGEQTRCRAARRAGAGHDGVVGGHREFSLVDGAGAAHLGERPSRR